MKRQVRNISIAGGLLLAVSACSKDGEPGPRGPRPDEVPESVSVAGGKMVSAVKIGLLREERDLPSFRITRMPIRVRDYRQCVDAGACSPPSDSSPQCQRSDGRMPDRATYSASPDDGELPVTCATPKQATAYCAWQGARLPSADEFLVAARGRDPRRYAWGDDDARCDQHPSGARVPSAPHACCQRDCSERERFSLGQRSASTSPSGVVDVLMTPAELLRVTDNALFGACAAQTGACLVTGLRPGAIDSFLWVPNETKESPAAIPTYGFRCVWEVKS